MVDIDFANMSLEQILEIRERLVMELNKRQEQEISAYVERGRSLAEVLGISFDELLQRMSRKVRNKVEARYRHPETGATWTGRGKMPAWLRQEIESGKSLEDFKVSFEDFKVS